MLSSLSLSWAHLFPEKITASAGRTRTASLLESVVTAHTQAQLFLAVQVSESNQSRCFQLGSQPLSEAQNKHLQLACFSFRCAEPVCLERRRLRASDKQTAEQFQDRRRSLTVRLGADDIGKTPSETSIRKQSPANEDQAAVLGATGQTINGAAN